MSLHPEQRRTVIIRGRGQSEMDTLLPIFANLVERNTPLSPEDFDKAMIAGIKNIFPSQTNKTHRNYLTEIIGQLFSMFYIDSGLVEISPLALKLISDGDQPAFFKVLVSRLQFPNPSAKIHKYDAEIADSLAVKPLVLALELFLVAFEKKDKINFEELAYYLFNSVEALRGEHTGVSLHKDIMESRKRRIRFPSFTGSAARQHIKEALNLLVLANLIRSDGNQYWLNQFEVDSAKAITALGANNNLFRTRNVGETHDEFQQEWKKFLTSITGISSSLLETDIAALGAIAPKRLVAGKPKRRATDIGRAGELLVLDLENEAIEMNFPGKGWSAMDYTAMRGIGFDIESIFYDGSMFHGTPHRIEVKSTIRVTKPDVRGATTPDGFTLTRSEKMATESYGETFSIYRVYIYSGGYDIHILRNPAELGRKGLMNFVPDTWSIQYHPSDIPDDYELIEATV